MHGYGGEKILNTMLYIQVSVGDLLAESNIVLGHTSVAGEVDASMEAEPWST